MPVDYPATLPRPSSFSFRARERRAVSQGDGPQQLRARSRDAIVDAKAMWRYSASEMERWTAWYRDELLWGQRWFAMSLPGDLGEQLRVARFVSAVDRSHLGAGVFEVSAELEVRSRALVALVYSSWPYPIEVPESFDAGVAIPQRGWLWQPPREAFAAGVAIPLAGTLEDVLVEYGDAAADEFEVGVALPLAGTLEDVLLSYTDAMPDEFDVGVALPLSGTLERVLLSYTDAVPDVLDVGVAIPLGGTLV